MVLGVTGWLLVQGALVASTATAHRVLLEIS